MSPKWSCRVAPKPPINPSKIKLLFASVLDALGRRPRQGQTLIFDDPLNENEGFMLALWAVFWSVFGAKMGFRWGPKWAVNVTKNPGQKWMEK